MKRPHRLLPDLALAAFGGRRFPHRRRSPLWKSTTACLAVFAATQLVATLVPTEWQYRQDLEVAVPGLTRVAVPAATFDAARPGLADLRLLDASGRETAYLLDRDPGEPLPPATRLRPLAFVSTTGPEGTQLMIETGTKEKLEAIDLESAAPFFLKAAHVEISNDGKEWESLGPAVPVFRQFGAEQLRLPLNRKAVGFVRVTLDNSRSRPVAFSGARLQPVPARPAPPPLVPVGAQVTRRDEFAGETVLTVVLDGRQVPLAELVFALQDPLFMRRVTIAVREVRDAVSGERIVGTGTLYRVALEGAELRAQLSVPLDFIPATRELLVHIHNGDSPPLALGGVQARQHAINLLFMAPAAGSYTLLTGNAQVAPPRYDLAAFASDLRTADAATATPGAIGNMPGYRPRESLAEAPLPDVPLAGAPLDVKDWPGRKSVVIARPGVQELELDVETLAHARLDGADLRLLRGGNQIPYIMERPALARSLVLTPAVTPDSKRPSTSLWQLRLPHAGLPLRRLVLSSSTPLFQRQVRIFEKIAGTDGGTLENTLATSAWSRTPEPGLPETKVFDLSERLRTDTIWIETDNGDNPPIVLGTVQAVYPVVRLIFKVAETDGFELAYGNQAALAPRYDLNLVAVKLLTASRSPATIGATTKNAARAAQGFAGLNSGYIFWGALALVVVVLLVVVAKLLPKPPAA